ncbi:hypothetical protein CHLRE_06g278260v5 [Chlamydomonas reinhardtii]|uniref:protein-serine/threonine phosphatase n=1 Tax=Chlamydomonas reinhardtii TaxID=3055 RepID=A0A2K3DPA9_CHLRE|nr:uncharacterized protein CHLRE_06g278260v5 [Chlamydomonas reinhardtii]PNW82373.1 hypothetical protein CHLRE_06g278260v5 [Chlamydomonas reinhardtii]
MPVANATFVAGTNRRLPTPDKSGGFEGPPERILRLSFQVNELPVVLPSLVTRERWQVRREPPPSSISSSNSSSSMGGGFGSSSSRLPASTGPAAASPAAAGAAAADDRGVWVPHQALAVAPLLNMVQALVRTGRRYVEPHLGGSSTGTATTIATAADLHRSNSSSTGSSTGGSSSSSSSSHSSSGWALTSPSSSTSNTPSTPNTPSSGSSTPGSSTLGSSTPGSSSSSAGAAWGALPPPPPRIDAAGVSLAGYAPGYKEVNQDAALLVDAFLSNRQQLLAVFDGHGPEGHRVSGFARRNLPHTLLHQLLEGGGEGQEEAGGAGGKEGKEQGRLAAAGGAGKTAGASGSGSGTGHGNASGSGSGSGSGFNSTGGGGRGGGAVQGALWRAVESLDAQLAVSGIDVVNSGTTAAMCHVHGRALTAAWVGDSRIVLGVPAAAPAAGVVAASGGAAAEHKTGSGGEGGGGSGGGLSSSLRGLGISSSSGDVVAAAAAEGGAAPAIKWGHPPAASPPDGGGSGGSGWRVVWQSTDHKPELPAEAARIEAAGGRVARSVGPQGPVGPFRVWFKKQDYPGLAMSRALGDLPGRQIGVVATPSTAALTLPPEGRPAVLVLASDGVWELMSNEQVLALAGNAGSAAEAASRVVQQSRRAWVKEYGGSYIDDITAVVVRFNMPPTARAQTLGAGAAGAAGSKL